MGAIEIQYRSVFSWQVLRSHASGFVLGFGEICNTKKKSTSLQVYFFIINLFVWFKLPVAKIDISGRYPELMTRS